MIRYSRTCVFPAIVSEQRCSEESFTSMRDFLIVEIIIPNGQRPGIIQGMLIGEAKRARMMLQQMGITGSLLQIIKLGIFPAPRYLYTLKFIVL